ncbi:unnamed protein product [Urochloa decumbens]|uniref:DUF6598 domain-containing protein n=1 Tax=Urochloa decumbens TaxID=240449 RepID=A0ABC9F999_9POAL
MLGWCIRGRHKDLFHGLHTDDPVPRYVYNHGPPDTLQFFSIKVEGTSDGELCWPIHVFGLVAVRDYIDQNRNLVFDRQRDDCQTLTKEDPYLVLTGPTRAVVMNDESIPVTIEAELKVKGTDGSKDKCLIFAAAPLPSGFGSHSFELIADTYRNKLKVELGRIMACVEATIFVRVIDGKWPAGFHGQIVGQTSSINRKKVVLVEFVGDVPVSDGNVDQSRFVVSVEAFEVLMVSYKAWRGDEVMEGEVAFKPEKKGKVMELSRLVLAF